MTDDTKLRLFGTGPYPFTPQEMELVAYRFMNKTMAYVATQAQGVDFFPGEHVHSSYEFIVPQRPFPLIHINNKRLSPQYNKLLAINSDRKHGPCEHCKGAHFIAWMIEKELVHQIAQAEWRKKHLIFDESFVTFTSKLQALITLFVEECSNPKPGKKFFLDNLSTQIVITLLRQLPSNLQLAEPSSLPSAKIEIERTLQFIQDNYNIDYSLSDVAKVANLSPFYFTRLFRQQVGVTPYEFLLRIRIKRARSLLKNSSLSITEIGLELGFHNPNHFTSAFKRLVGTTPSRYRRNL